MQTALIPISIGPPSAPRPAGVSLRRTPGVYVAGGRLAPAVGPSARLASGPSSILPSTLTGTRCASVRVGDGLIALTSAGVLLRFELPAVRPVRERIENDEIICIGSGEGGAVLAGLADGRVCRIDPMTLNLSELAKLPTAPSGLAGAPPHATDLRVCRRYAAHETRRTGPAALGCSLLRDQRPRDEKDVRARIPGEHGPARPRRPALDRGRQWGVGRSCHPNRPERRVGHHHQAAASSQTGAKPLWGGVYGFIELRNGQVWAFGGTSHMGINEGEITRVDEGEGRTLVAFRPPADLVQPQPDTGLPAMPITHVIEEKEGLLVFSYSDVFRVDKALKPWKKAATLDIQYRWGRPDAMGSYPAVPHRPSADS